MVVIAIAEVIVEVIAIAEVIVGVIAIVEVIEEDYTFLFSSSVCICNMYNCICLVTLTILSSQIFCLTLCWRSFSSMVMTHDPTMLEGRVPARTNRAR